jgi:starch synthase
LANESTRRGKRAGMNILFVATELAPFVKVGGLADVTAGLTKALRILGHKVTIVLPRFRGFEDGGLLVARRLTPIKIVFGDRSFDVTVFDGRLASQVDLVLVDAPGLYDRRDVYGEKGEGYPDNLLRFSLLSRAATEIARQRAIAGSPFDIVHLHDWPAALAAPFLKEAALTTSELSRTRSVLTLHNLAHQGTFPREALPDTGLAWDHFRVEGIEFYGNINVLKYGIITADAVTTVSENYAREIQTAERGERLDGVLRGRTSALIGITNGIDYAVWNPATDPALAARYDAEGLLNRVRCRGALQQELGLSIDPVAPIVASVGRMVEQKGTDLLADALPRIVRSCGAQVVVAGDGDPGLVARVEAAAQKSEGHVAFARGASEGLVHRIFAGADIVVLPSRHEPCGLVQMYAQRYGALPVANATGGIVDTVVDCDSKLETGTGFLFAGATVDNLVGGVQRAVASRASPGWPRLLSRVMRLDRGWERPARRYEQVYRQLTR